MAEVSSTLEMTPKDKYRELCTAETSIPLFSRAWWLDATAGEDWDVVLVERDRRIMASLPFVIRRRFGFTILSQPPLTQFLGPWLRPLAEGEIKHSTRLSYEKELVQALIDCLPDYDRFSQNFHFKVTNWLPFYWNGFRQTTRYTYRIEDLSDEMLLWSNLDSQVRGHIRKAERSSIFVSDLHQDIEPFIKLNEYVFVRQGLEVPYSAELVRGINSAAKRQESGRVLLAKGADGEPLAGAFLVWDEHSVYEIMAGRSSEPRARGARTLCVWEAIRFAAQINRSFDFEGSMIEGVEQFVRGFGAIQTPYHAVSHTPSLVLNMLQGVREVRRASRARLHRGKRAA